MNAPRILLPILLATAFQANTVEAEERAKTVATIVEARGKCYVRSGEAGSSQLLQSGVKLSAGQEVLCDLGGSLKIRFDVTSDERPIVPRWTKIGNVPAPLDPLLPFRGHSRAAGYESNPVTTQPPSNE